MSQTVVIYINIAIRVLRTNPLFQLLTVCSIVQHFDMKIMKTFADLHFFRGFSKFYENLKFLETIVCNSNH